MPEENDCIFADIYLRGSETIIFQLENCKRKRKPLWYDAMLGVAVYTLGNAKDCGAIETNSERVRRLEDKIKRLEEKYKSVRAKS